MLNPPRQRPWRIDVDGLDRLPDGPVVLVVNRVGAFDHLQVVSSLGRPAVVVTEPGDGLREFPWLSTTRWSADPARAQHPGAALDRGQVLVVFPEGAAGNDGRVHKGHAEFAALALARRVPVVPAALRPGAGQQTNPIPGIGRLRYQLRIGKPVDLDRFQQIGAPTDTVDGLILRGVTDLVMTRICQLSGRRYHDSYTGAGRGPTSGAASLGRLEQARRDRAERRVADGQRRLAEAELARLLDEQDAAAVEEAAEAARQHAEQAAQADELAREERRRQTPGQQS